MTRATRPGASFILAGAAAWFFSILPYAHAQTSGAASPDQPGQMRESSPPTSSSPPSSSSPAPTSGDEEDSAAPDAATPEGEPAADEPSKDLTLGDRLTVTLGVEATNSYYFRGLLVEREKFILQPYASIEALLVEDDEFSLSLAGGTWNYIHDVTTGIDNPDNEDFTDHWYEADWWIAATVSQGPWSLCADYEWYTSPSDAFDTAQELLLTLSYDDSAWWGDEARNPHKFAIAPALELGVETDGASDGIDEGVSLVPMLTPGFTWEMPLVGETRFDFPLAAGFSLDDYYQDENGDDDVFGFFSVGAKAAIALSVPKGFGEWSLAGGVTLLVLDGNTQALNFDDDTAVIATIGLEVSF